MRWLRWRQSVQGTVDLDSHAVGRLEDVGAGEVRSDSADGIALWMIDADYDEEQFFVRHAYFSGGQDPYRKLRTALKAEIDPDAWESLYGTVSRPFPPPSTGRIAVKAINYYGDEVLVVREVP